MLLRLDGVSKSFGGLQVLRRVTFGVSEGAILGIIGPNGAGKTTLFNTITGVFPPSEGRIVFGEHDITRMRTEERARYGISRTFQYPHVFRSLTVWENVMLGRHHRARSGLLACGLRLRGARREERRIREEAAQYLALVGLAEQRDRLARELPLGQQRYLEVARALATEPRLLLLDEPTAGLDEQEMEGFGRLIFDVRARGITVLVIEHRMRFIMGLCEEIVVLNFGSVICMGPPEAVQRSPEVITAYLGAEDDRA